jgi:hypothetical protein
MCEKWKCYAWEGKHSMCGSYIKEACHRRHAEMNLIHQMRLKGVF